MYDIQSFKLTDKISISSVGALTIDLHVNCRLRKLQKVKLFTFYYLVLIFNSKTSN